MTGKLVAIEGIDGSGKSSLVKYLEEKLKKEGHSVVRVVTREPDTEHIFKSAMEAYSLDIHSPAAMFFFQMLHACKVERTKQALSQGKIVVADRWDFSFFVSHENFGFFSRESAELREEVSRLAFGGLKPDLGIYLDVSVECAIERRLWRKEVIDDIERERRYCDKITKSYNTLVRRHNWQIVDANQNFGVVWQNVWELAKGLLG